MKFKFKFVRKIRYKSVESVAVSKHTGQMVRAISVDKRLSPPQEIHFLQEAEKKGYITNVTWLNSDGNGVDDDIKHVIKCLKTDSAKKYNYYLKNQYDYAWLKIAIDYGNIPNRFAVLKYMSTPKFVQYIKSLGYFDIAGPKTLNKELAKAFWCSKNNSITFPMSHIGIIESKRRNCITQKFLEILNEI